MKTILFCLLVLYSAASAAGDWIADKKTGCQVWNAHPAPNESISYSGACVEGKSHGKGTLQAYVNGKPTARLEGVWEQGKLSGKGILTWANGARYEGDFIDNKRTGKGILFDQNGAVRFDGNFVDGKFSEKVIVTNENGAAVESSSLADFKKIPFLSMLESILLEDRISIKVEGPESGAVDRMKSIMKSPTPTLLVVDNKSIDSYDQTFGGTFFNDFQYVSIILSDGMILLSHKSVQASHLHLAFQGIETLRIGVPLSYKLGALNFSLKAERDCSFALNATNPQGFKLIELSQEEMLATLFNPDKINRKVDITCRSYSKRFLNALAPLSPEILAVTAPTGIPELIGKLNLTKFGVPPQFLSFFALYGNKAVTESEISRIKDTLRNERSIQRMQAWIKAHDEGVFSTEYFPAISK